MTTRRRLVLAGSWLAAWPLGVAADPAPQTVPATPAPSSCVTCHGALDETLRTAWPQDVHAQVGLGCESCHGGDPSSALADDAEAAMSAARGYRGAPGRLEVPASCGGCHSDATYMKRFDPQLRVDQLAEYRTSVHGQRNAAGDPVPATCVDCHGVHGIRPVDAPDSPVHARNVPATCARCHGDPATMGPYRASTTAFDEYRGSVHADALLRREDLAAPACNDCHGNHGAAPPGVGSVANVCGQCHAREARLFRDSFKKDLFDALGVGECSVCHGTHAIAHPGPEWFHSGSEPRVSRGRVVSRRPFSAELGDVGPGERVEATWLVSIRPHAEETEALVHRVVLSAGGAELVELDATVRPGSAVSGGGPTRAATGELAAALDAEPLAGDPVEAGDALRLRLVVDARAPIASLAVHDRVGRAIDPVAGSVCMECHASGDACDRATEAMYAALSATERELREAASGVAEAGRRGMDVSEAAFLLHSRGRTAAVESRALIHAFDPARLVARTGEGREVARTALEAARAALAEWQFRRKGLAVSLLLIALVLVGLYAKIRQLDRQGVRT
jgi:hypothetical protein